MIKEGVNMIAGFKKKSRLSPVLQWRVVQWGVFVPVCMGRWCQGTSYTAEFCRLQAPYLFPSLVIVSSEHWPVLIWVLSCAGSLWSQREMWSNYNVFFFSRFLILRGNVDLNSLSVC